MSLNTRRARQLREAAAPLLHEGERVRLTSLVGVGSVSVGTQALTATVAAVLSGGTMTATITPRPLYVALTDRRVLFFDGNRGGKPAGAPVLELPRAHVVTSGTKRAFLGLQYVTHLSVAGQEKGLKITFPVQHRADGPRFVSALSATG
jgi:hypothetical protein